jgi:hypothetical protein
MGLSWLQLFSVWPGSAHAQICKMVQDLYRVAEEGYRQWNCEHGDVQLVAVMNAAAAADDDDVAPLCPAGQGCWADL